MVCIDLPKRLSRTNNVIPGCVPGHSKIGGNKLADGLAKVGAETPINRPDPYLGLPKGTVTNNTQECMDYESIHI